VSIPVSSFRSFVEIDAGLTFDARSLVVAQKPLET
jgi:hypothetical protein